MRLRRSRRFPCCPSRTATRSHCSRRSPDQWCQRSGAAAFRSPIASARAPRACTSRSSSTSDLKPLYDVIARLPGTTEADEWVIRGNHHDAWVNGAEDPISGLVAELEEARALGELYKQGWRPKRTIIYAAWDGEEPGLLGSTEWAEAHADALPRMRSRTSTATPTAAATSASKDRTSLEKFINGVEKDISDPESNVSSWKRNQAASVMQGNAEARAAWRPAHRRARLGLGLHALPPAPRDRVAQRRLRRRGRRGHLPFDL